MTSDTIPNLFWAKVDGVSIPLYQDSTTYGAFIASSTYSQGSAHPGYRYRHDSDAPVVLTFGVTGLPSPAGSNTISPLDSDRTKRASGRVGWVRWISSSAWSVRCFASSIETNVRSRTRLRAPRRSV